MYLSVGDLFVVFEMRMFVYSTE